MRQGSVNAHISVADGPNQGDWVNLQKTTFTNWARENIRRAYPDETIDDLATTFEDGVRLIKLVEVVSGKKAGRYKSNPKVFSQKLDNIKMALDVLVYDGIKLVNIGPEDVHSGNLKLILGLIWRMILHYQISSSSNVSGKLLLITWLQAAAPDVEIKNLTSDWNDGRAFAGLMEFLEPGTYPDYKNLRVSDNKETVTRCMNMAEEKYGIPQVISPEMVVSQFQDELSMMTYLSYFTQVGSPGEKATLRFVNDSSPNLRVTNFNTDWSNGVNLVRFSESVCPGIIPNYEEALEKQSPAENVDMCFDAVERNVNIKRTMNTKDVVSGNIDELSLMAYVLQFRGVKVQDNSNQFKVDGPALRNGMVGNTAEFDVVANRGMTFENLQVSVESPSGNKVPVTCEETGVGLHCSYLPTESGTHVISVRHLNNHVPLSPFRTAIREDVSEVAISGAGLKSAVYRDKTEFQVSSSGSHTAPLAVAVHGPTSTIPAEINEANGKYEVSFVPTEVGEHSVDVRFGDTLVPGSPFKVMVGDPKRVVVPEREAMEQGFLNKPVEFNVDTSNAGRGTLTASGRGPNDKVNVNIHEIGDTLYKVSFLPSEAGEYTIQVYYNGKEIGSSPFTTTIADPGKAVAHGEGLYQVRLHEREEFLVSLHGAGKGQLEIAAVSPSGETVPVDLQLSDSEPDTYVVNYTPMEIGDHKIYVKFAGINVRGSPFIVKVADPSKVLIQMSSLTEAQNAMVVDKEVVIPLEVLPGAGEGELEAEIAGPGDVAVESSFTRQSDTLYHFRFIPPVSGEYIIKMFYGGGLVGGHALNAFVKDAYVRADASKCVVYGEGIKESKVDERGEFNIDCRDAGEGVITAKLQGVKYTTDVEVENKYDGTYDCHYLVPIPGAYVLHVLFDGENVPGSPFKVNITGHSEVSQCIVRGDALTKGGWVGRPMVFSVVSGSSGSGLLVVRCQGPSRDCDVAAYDNKDGTYSVEIYPTETGRHLIYVEWGGKPVEGSPFVVKVTMPPDASKVVAHGTGLEHGVVNDYEGKFMVETKGAGAGTLKIKIHGPKGAFKVEMFRENTKDRNIGVRYNPTEPGRYDISVKWAEEHVPGSPYTVYVGANDEDLRRLSGNQPNGYNGYADNI
ncbi:filamin-C-like [Dendronephthya gigantea]|uniref:filamin-C-like n=1 Tax=Dendronephthya gigantea TaxID=151771 RepID=UPI0010690F89|nr:filamin-C-like [Dendronephthya gigantea]